MTARFVGSVEFFGSTGQPLSSLRMRVKLSANVHVFSFVELVGGYPESTAGGPRCRKAR